MADKKISQLNEAGALDATEEAAVVQSGETKRLALADLFRGLPDGSAAAPALAFSSDPDTGIRLSNPGVFRIVISGTDRFTMTDTAFGFNNTLNIIDQNILLGTTTGTEIGTAANQKLGFFGATPVVQQNVPLTTPSVQDVIDALVALGLVEQSD